MHPKLFITATICTVRNKQRITIEILIKNKKAMGIRSEIHSNISKDEAYKLMEQGHEICHERYADDEYLKMTDGVIYDENGYFMGTKHGDFWSKRQRWETGWMTTNAR